MNIGSVCHPSTPRLVWCVCRYRWYGARTIIFYHDTHYKSGYTLTQADEMWCAIRIFTASKTIPTLHHFVWSGLEYRLKACYFGTEISKTRFVGYLFGNQSSRSIRTAFGCSLILCTYSKWAIFEVRICLPGRYIIRPLMQTR